MKKSVLISLHAFVLLSSYMIYVLAFHFTETTLYPNSPSSYDVGYYIGSVVGIYLRVAGLFYFGYLFIANKFFKKQNFLVLIISVIIISIVFSLNSIFGYISNGWDKFSSDKFLHIFFFTAFYCTYGFLFRIFIDWFRNQQKKKELENEKLKTKLLLLTSQSNPHFIFNVLNNIDSLINTKPAKASEVICKLSNILRYIYSNSETDKVLLSSEIEYIEDYIELQKLRFDSEANIQFKKDEIPGNIKIIPMLFIPFIENAFKHGIINKRNPLYIKISYHNNQLYFECNNNYDSNKESIKTKSGLGILNVTKRLDLMYPSKYELDINEKDGFYSIKLTLQIDEN